MNPLAMIADYPGYTLFKGNTGAHATIHADGDKIGIPYQSRNHGTLHRFYKVYDRDGEAFLVALPTSISNMRTAKPSYVVYEHGETIYIGDKTYRLDPAPNGNTKLTAI